MAPEFGALNKIKKMNLFDISEHTPPNNAAQFAADFQTPINVCNYMASLMPDMSKLTNKITILEPTPGIGNLVTAIEQRLLKQSVTNYEITAPPDFFLLPKQRFDCIVMNPPFSSKFAFMQNAPMGKNKPGMRLGYHILLECMQMSDNIIALMPWFTISDSDVRLRNLKDFGLKSLTALPRKTFQYARIQTVVIELQKGYTGTTNFEVFDRLELSYTPK